MDRYLLLLCLLIHESRAALRTTLLTHSSYKSLRLASANRSEQLIEVRTTRRATSRTFRFQCDVAVGIKTLFDLINRTSTEQVILTDACQTVLSALAETTTHFQLPVVSRCDFSPSLLLIRFGSSWLLPTVISRSQPMIVTLSSIKSFHRITRRISFGRNFYGISIGHGSA